MKIKAMLTFCLLICTVFAQAQKDEVDELLALNDKAQVNKRLSVLGSGTESDITIVARYYNARGQFNRSDSVQRIAVKRFPKGNIAYEYLTSDFLKENELQKKEVMLANARINFPERDLERLDFSMIDAYVSANNLNSALTFVESSIEARKNNKSTNYELLNKYSMILSKQGKYDKALKYADLAYPNLAYKDDETIKNYTRLLSLSKRYPEVVKILEPKLINGTANQAIKYELKSAYQFANPTKNADSYILGLRKFYLAKLKEDFIKKMISKPAPAVIGKDSYGKEVRLSQFKGKTVVIDFWATWCAPCKKSFPAMQTVVNKYAKDPDVIFIFLHTAEATPDPLKDAGDYLKANGFDFKLLMDYRNPATKNCPVATSFGVNGLPTKIVIDGDGNVRFSVGGFLGNDDVLVDELSTMIELVTKKN